MASHRERIAIAAIAAPFSTLITVPLAMIFEDLALHASASKLFYDLWATIGMQSLGIGICALLTMFVAGIPAYLIAVRLKIASIWSAALVGAVAPFFVPVLLFVFNPRGINWTLPFWGIVALAGLCTVGSVVGIVFWLIVRLDPDSNGRR